MKVKILLKAEKRLKSAPIHIQEKILIQIDKLAQNPFLKSSTKLSGQQGYRIRVGDWRIIYLFDKKKKLILVVLIAHRKEVYK
jgi:mRNA interferase RelE/StbE